MPISARKYYKAYRRQSRGEKHLENLGFVVGGEATLITSMAGNVIVNVKETRVAVSREMAQKSWFDFCFVSYSIWQKEE